MLVYKTVCNIMFLKIYLISYLIKIVNTSTRQEYLEYLIILLSISRSTSIDQIHLDFSVSVSQVCLRAIF